MATGDILSITVQADNYAATGLPGGWYADIVISGLNTGGTYNFGLGSDNDPATGTPKLALTVVSLGFDDTGAATTVTRTVYGTHAIRKPYPNDTVNWESYNSTSSQTTIRVALSDYIYAKDNTGTGNSGTAIVANVASGLYTYSGTPSNAATNLTVTNNSNRAYPSVVGNWTMPGYDKLGSSFKLRAACFHHSAQQGRPVRAVVFTATDQHSHTATTTVNSPSVDSSVGDAIPVVEYIGTMDATTLTQGDTLTLNFKAYPWIGDSGSVLDSSTGTVQYTPLIGPIQGVCDKTGAYCTSVAVVDPVGGNDSTGAVTGSFNSASPPAAYKTIAAAFNALCAYNNTTYSRNNAGGSIIYVRGTGTAEWVGGSITSGTTTPACSVLVAAYPGDSGCAIGTQTGGKNLGAIQKLQGLSIADGGVVSFFDGTSFLWLDDCTLNCTGTAPIYGVTVFHLTRCSITALANGISPFSTTNASPGIARGNTNPSGGTALGGVLAYTVVGNHFASMSTAVRDVVTSQGTPATANMVVAYNWLTSSTSTNLVIARETSQSDTHGFAIVQNILENTVTDTQPVLYVAADGSDSLTPVNNALIWHNVVVGGRANLSYNDTGTASAERWGWSIKNNLFDLHCIKSDTFNDPTNGQNGSRIGNWACEYGVGSSGNINGDYTGFQASGSFCLEFAGLKCDQQPTSGEPPGCSTRAAAYPQFVNRKSYNGSANGTGGGDYHLSATSPAISLQRDYVLKYDIAGNTRSATDASGAYSASTSATVTAASAQLRLRSPAATVTTVSNTTIHAPSAQARARTGPPALLTTSSSLQAPSAQARVRAYGATVTTGSSATIHAPSAQLRARTGPPSVTTTSSASVQAPAAQIRVRTSPPSLASSSTIKGTSAQVRARSYGIAVSTGANVPEICFPTTLTLASATNTLTLTARTSTLALTGPDSTLDLDSDPSTLSLTIC